nr:diacylglycerol kinase family lipid kinase [bacterium]
MDVIINPVAGHGRALKVGRAVMQVLKEKGIAARELYTEAPGHARELAQLCVSQGTDRLLTIGGDGTAFEACGGVMGSDTALGIIPAGTGNDFVRALNLPKKPLDVLEHILSHPARQADIGCINGRPFINICGTGFDVSVLDYAEPVKRFVRGQLPYLWGVIRTILSYHPAEMVVRVDGQEVASGKMLVCAVANGRFYGGGIPIAPKASVEDGLLDVVLVDNMKRGRMMACLPGLLKGKILSFKETKHLRGHRVEIASPGMRLNVDGEIFPMTYAMMEIKPKALKVLG